MTPSDRYRTQAVRAWLAAEARRLSPRVLENVLREFPATNQHRPHWAAPWPQFSSFAAGAAVGAAAVMLVVAVIGAGLFGRFQPSGIGTTPTPTQSPSPTPRAIDYSYREVGFIGLPPRGATQATRPKLNWLRLSGVPGRHTRAAFLYADGRLIWNEYFREESTGWLQSLTDDGIELVLRSPASSFSGRGSGS